MAFFLSPEQSCDYIPAETWQHLCFQLDTLSPESLDIIMQLGFRHFGSHFFRTFCPSCQAQRAAHSLKDFKLSASQKRVRSKNRDLIVQWHSPNPSSQALALHNKWQNQKSQSLGWTPKNLALKNLEAFAKLGSVSLQQSVYTPKGTLIAVAFVDKGKTTGNSIYSYYDLDFSWRSLEPSLFERIRYLKTVD